MADHDLGQQHLDRDGSAWRPSFLPAGPHFQLEIRRVRLDTGRENVVVISRQSKAQRAEIFRGLSRVELRPNGKVLLATLTSRNFLFISAVHTATAPGFRVTFDLYDVRAMHVASCNCTFAERRLELQRPITWHLPTGRP